VANVCSKVYDQLKDNNFDNTQQPEIAIWPPKPRNTCIRKYDRYDQNFNVKPETFDHFDHERERPQVFFDE